MGNWYARFPIMLEDSIYFVAGNDLFRLDKNSKQPHLCFQTNENLWNLFPCANAPKIACVSNEDGGPDIYIFNKIDNTFERLTFFEKKIEIVQFNSKTISFICTKDGAFRNSTCLYEYDFASQTIKNTQINQINWMDKDDKDSIFQKYGYGYLNWKGYKGGTAGQLWINDKKLITLPGNCLRPNIIKDRIYFLYDDGTNGNVFSCTKAGKDLKQNTFHKDFHVQDLIKHGTQLLYTTGGKIGIFDTIENKDTILELSGNMPHPNSRCFVPCPQKFMTSIDSDGTNIAVAIRGNVFKKQVFSGGLQKMTKDLRYRICGILNDKNYFAFKEPPESTLVIFDANNKEIKKIAINNCKIAMAKPSPAKNFIAYINHKHELHIIDYATGSDEIIFTAQHALNIFDWSSNGEYLVYSASGNMYQSKIRIYNTTTKEHHDITDGRSYDLSPTFDPSGKFIAFISNRNAKCDYDPIRFDMNFAPSNRVYIVPLEKNYNPLMPWKNETEETDEKKEEAENEKKQEEKNVKIDFDGIQDRIIPLPCERKNYSEIFAINDSKILLVSSDDQEKKPLQGNELVETFCMKNLSKDVAYKNVSLVNISYNKEYCVIFEDEKFKILKTGEKGEENGYKKNSIFDLNAYRYHIEPKQEWPQILHEIWWLIREFFWSDKIADIDWEKVWKKYEPYVNNIRTRDELNDLINEIQGEMGTSHAFIWTHNEDEIQDDKRGYLGIETEFDEEKKKYKITNILPSNFESNLINPILAANCDVKIGDFLIAIDKEILDKKNTPDKALQRKANASITLEIESAGQTKTIDITAIESDTLLRYRKWVNQNREYVHKISDGLVGYVHIPDMQTHGFKEFFQNYLNEYEKDALIIDVRNNNGGNISPIIIEQLAKKRLGFDLGRHNGIIELPYESSKGSYVLLTNVNTASDGEIFSHSFKILKLGKIIGERTWGGVFGIAPRYPLIDGSLTSQPEIGTWFSDIQFSLENSGVSPDIEIINNHTIPNNCKNDAQLNEAIKEAMKLKSDSSMENAIKKSTHPMRKA